MKKIISIMLASIVLVLALASCTGGDPNNIAPEGMQLASDENCAYYLYIPENWALLDACSGGYVSYLDNEQEFGLKTDIANVTVSTFTAGDIKAEETGDTAETTADETVASERIQYIDAFWTMCKESYARELNGFTVVEEGKGTTLGLLDAKEYVYTANFDNTEYKMMMTVTYSGGVMYIVTYTAKTVRYDTHMADVEKILSEFKFK